MGGKNPGARPFARDFMANTTQVVSDRCCVDVRVCECVGVWLASHSNPDACHLDKEGAERKAEGETLR